MQPHMNFVKICSWLVSRFEPSVPHLGQEYKRHDQNESFCGLHAENHDDIGRRSQHVQKQWCLIARKGQGAKLKEKAKKKQNLHNKFVLVQSHTKTSKSQAGQDTEKQHENDKATQKLEPSDPHR